MTGHRLVDALPWMADVHGPCRCRGVGDVCHSCSAQIDAAEAAGDQGDYADDGFDRDYHYPRDLAPRGL